MGDVLTSCYRKVRREGVDYIVKLLSDFSGSLLCDTPYSEFDAYRLSEKLKLKVVPETLWDKGSWQKCVSLREVDGFDVSGWEEVFVLDVLTANMDRWWNNWYRSGHRVVAIDNGISLYCVFSGAAYDWGKALGSDHVSWFKAGPEAVIPYESEILDHLNKPENMKKITKIAEGVVHEWKKVREDFADLPELDWRVDNLGRLCLDTLRRRKA